MLDLGVLGVLLLISGCRWFGSGSEPELAEPPRPTTPVPARPAGLGQAGTATFLPGRNDFDHSHAVEAAGVRDQVGRGPGS